MRDEIPTCGFGRQIFFSSSKMATGYFDPRGVSTNMASVLLLFCVNESLNRKYLSIDSFSDN